MLGDAVGYWRCFGGAMAAQMGTSRRRQNTAVQIANHNDAGERLGKAEKIRMVQEKNLPPAHCRDITVQRCTSPAVS
jgi:hypothetical protein